MLLLLLPRDRASHHTRFSIFIFHVDTTRSSTRSSSEWVGRWGWGEIEMRRREHTTHTIDSIYFPGSRIFLFICFSIWLDSLGPKVETVWCDTKALERCLWGAVWFGHTRVNMRGRVKWWRWSQIEKQKVQISPLARKLNLNRCIKQTLNGFSGSSSLLSLTIRSVHLQSDVKWFFVIFLCCRADFLKECEESENRRRFQSYLVRFSRRCLNLFYFAPMQYRPQSHMMMLVDEKTSAESEIANETNFPCVCDNELIRNATGHKPAGKSVSTTSEASSREKGLTSVVSVSWIFNGGKSLHSSTHSRPDKRL